MSKIENANLTNNNLQFLLYLQREKYPVATLFKEHLREHHALKNLSELHLLEVVIHRLKTKQALTEYITTTWLLRSCILMLLEYPLKSEEKQDLDHLEMCLSHLADDALSNATRLDKLINDAVIDGQPIDEFSASLDLVKLCLKLREINIQKMKRA